MKKNILSIFSLCALMGFCSLSFHGNPWIKQVFSEGVLSLSHFCLLLTVQDIIRKKQKK